eukprot:NODE_140_length_16098_cov_0.678605.p15 type:complete len:134 gc:universal NODE_140_length_16098_cov_0.678605:1616-1215(-)
MQFLIHSHEGNCINFIIYLSTIITWVLIPMAWRRTLLIRCRTLTRWSLIVGTWVWTRWTLLIISLWRRTLLIVTLWRRSLLIISLRWTLLIISLRRRLLVVPLRGLTLIIPLLRGITLLWRTWLTHTWSRLEI